MGHGTSDYNNLCFLQISGMKMIQPLNAEAHQLLLCFNQQIDFKHVNNKQTYLPNVGCKQMFVNVYLLANV